MWNLGREITIAIHRGSATFSFKTDGDGTGIAEALMTIKQLLKEHGESLNALGTIEVIKREELGPKKLPEKYPQISFDQLNVPKEVLVTLQAKIRKVPYVDLVLLLLYFAPRSLSYDDIISLSKEIKKPVSYNWLNTEFHRRKYSGLVRSEELGGSQKRIYSLNEPGRRRAEVFLNEFKKS